MDKNYEEIVPQQQRNQVFAQQKTCNKNNICIDCEKKNPTWTSIHLGLHLCTDCVAKHRQYGIMYSFTKSKNLDGWNQKQLLFMQKGGNNRALDYFKKCGILSDTHKHIDYKSPIVQKYKQILTAEVQAQIHGKPIPKKQIQLKKKQDTQTNLVLLKQKIKQIPNTQTVNIKEQKGKKKKKNKIGTKINIQFNNMEFDDGVPIQERDQIRKAYENTQTQSTTKQQQNVKNQNPYVAQQKTKIQQPKQLSEEEIKKKLQQLKTQSNVKHISSDTFKDTSKDQVTLKQNLNKLKDKKSISSSDVYGEKVQSENQTIGKVKQIVTDVGGKLFNKISSYWSKQ